MQLFSSVTVLAMALLVGTPKKEPSTRIAIQKEKGWISLFDGKTTKGWHTFGKTYAGEAWKVVDGALFLDAANKTKEGGDLVSDGAYENFHLQLDWKISKNGNSGVIFWVQDDSVKYKNTWHTGPEMQVLDNDGHADGKINKHRAGNLYDLIAGKEAAVKPVGEWNTAEIISNKGELTFILNGITVLATKYGDDNWRQMIAGSKFKTKSDFGLNFKGHIALQDHGNEVWYKNIKLKKL